MAKTQPASKTRIKKGDTVQVISGKDRGAIGKVLLVMRRDDRILVEGVNRIKKHTKVTSTTRGAQEGGIITQEAPVHISNVALVVEHEGARVPTRIGVRRDADGNKVRVSRRTGEDIS
jgi:large subunit ribosomal protein L24